MTDKKKTKQKEEEEEKESMPTQEDLINEIQRLGRVVESVVAQAASYQQLCAHYEQTINVMTGRLLEGRSNQQTENRGN